MGTGGYKILQRKKKLRDIFLERILAAETTEVLTFIHLSI